MRSNTLTRVSNNPGAVQIFNPSAAVYDVATNSLWDSARLRAESHKRMRLLAGIGFGAGDRAVITHGNSASFFADLLAVWSRGGRPFRSTRRWAKSSSRTS